MKIDKLGYSPKLVTFNCTSCHNEYQILSSHKENLVNIDICSKCHPFYLGKSNLSRNLGPAEKLKSKFDAGKNYASKNKK